MLAIKTAISIDKETYNNVENLAKEMNVLLILQSQQQRNKHSGRYHGSSISVLWSVNGDQSG